MVNLNGYVYMIDGKPVLFRSDPIYVKPDQYCILVTYDQIRYTVLLTSEDIQDNNSVIAQVTYKLIGVIPTKEETNEP